MHVRIYPTMSFATLRPSELQPSFAIIFFLIQLYINIYNISPFIIIVPDRSQNLYFILQICRVLCLCLTVAPLSFVPSYFKIRFSLYQPGYGANLPSSLKIIILIAWVYHYLSICVDLLYDFFFSSPLQSFKIFLTENLFNMFKAHKSVFDLPYLSFD